MTSATVTTPTWQCVLICWGEKYGVNIINGLIDSVLRHSASPPRFVLITDREREGLRAGVQTVRFPDRWLLPQLKGSGCQAKLVMFETGILTEDLPAVYIDLDTVVLGDMARLLALLDTPQSVAILHSAIIPFGYFGRWLHRVSQGKRYARGNSSVVVFHPAHTRFIAERFMDLLSQYPRFEFRPMVADERFISWVAQPHMRTVPAQQVVKFPRAYMFYWSWVLYLKAAMPWVKTRRARQLAVTLNGLLIKPEKLLDLKEGDVIVDEKNRKLVWSVRTMGAMKQTILDFYASTAR
jgi:hypothetical protein